MAIHDARSQRLFIDAPLTGGGVIDLDRDQANYLLNVLRMPDGAPVLVFNGRDGEWQARTRIAGRKKCALVLEAQTRPQPKPAELVYCFAPLKQARQDYMVQKAVEMGAGVLQPVITRHTQVRQVNGRRMRANAVEAAEQCGILHVPEVREPVPLTGLASCLEPGTRLFFCDEHAPGAKGLAKPERGITSPIALLVGPEGGFSGEEREFVMSLEHVVPLGLGPRVLRADTAAVAALALIQATLGDWYDEQL